MKKIHIVFASAATISAVFLFSLTQVNYRSLLASVVYSDEFKSSYDYAVPEKTMERVFSIYGNHESKIKLQNTGDSSWYSDGNLRVGLAVKKDETSDLFKTDNLSKNKDLGDYSVVGWVNQTGVSRGGFGDFSFEVASPGRVGRYPVKLYLVVGDTFVIEDKPINLDLVFADKMVALTFDDGYGNIDSFIDTLNSQRVRGTFFMLGVVAQNQPEQMKRILREGHMLASHSLDHPDFRTLTDDGIRWQLSHTREIMKNITGYDVLPYFRYPYGAMNKRTHEIVEGEGWKWFHWTQSTGDYKHHENSAEGRSQVYYYSTLNPPDKSIVLMHIISQSSLNVLPDVIAWYRAHGYEFATIDEMGFNGIRSI